MDALRLEHHLTSPEGRGHHPRGGWTGAAGGAACGDLVRVTVALDGEEVVDAGFDASGCGAAQAAGSAVVALIRGATLWDAARIGSPDVAAELGGLSTGKLHAADLASDALHRALGHAARHATVARVTGRTLVAMSGGVDSAVAALELGAHAVAVTLELWSDPETDDERSCCSPGAVRSARTLAHSLGLPHLSLDLREEFRAGVVDPWLAGHAAGETPNPCVACNGEVRLDAMLDLADRLGCATLATGHYARTAEDGHPDGPLLRLAADPGKDQAYVLAALAPSSLARMRFPLGDLHKGEVRERAARAGLAVARKADSQDLCFLAGTGRARFLRRHGRIPDRPGELVAADGRVLGAHDGQHGFTVGQRRGIGVAAAEPLYVLGKDAARNRVTVGTRAELQTSTVVLRDLTLRRDPARVRAARLRYHARDLPATLDPGKPALDLHEPAARPAPGQMACLLDGDLVVGHATIA